MSAFLNERSPNRIRWDRHWSSRQGCKSGKVKVLSPSITCIGRIAYPERAEVTKHDMPGRKSLGCPVGKLAAVGAIWETTQTQRPEHNEMSATSKTIPRKVAFAERNGKPTHSVLGKADDIGEETGTSTRWDRRGRGPGIWGKICRIESGRARWQQGLVATCRDSRNEVNNRRKGEPDGFGA